MNLIDERRWAKEMIMDGIDRYLKQLFTDPINGFPDLDSQTALLKQRNRVATFLGTGNVADLRQFSKSVRPEPAREGGE